MLTEVRSGPAIVVCNTCRLSPERREDERARRGGALFADKLRTALINHPCSARVSIEEMPCLFACSNYCTVHVRCEGKIGYVLGRFSPSLEDAQTLLDYVALYAESTEGIVPYERWPQGVKGHFLVRTPPEGMVWRREPVAAPRQPSIEASPINGNLGASLKQSTAAEWLVLPLPDPVGHSSKAFRDD